MRRKLEAWFWLGAGAALVIAGEWYSWTTVKILGFSFNLGWLAVTYGFLLSLRNAILKRFATISDRELHDFADKLVEATPRLVEWLDAGERPAELARRLKDSDGIPEALTLKYILALGNYKASDQASKGGSASKGPRP
jgi:hypothetical protein